MAAATRCRSAAASASRCRTASASAASSLINLWHHKTCAHIHNCPNLWLRGGGVGGGGCGVWGRRVWGGTWRSEIGDGSVTVRVMTGI